jgi:predicted kinase
MKDLKVKILVGIPSSGKSTWSLDYVKNNSGWVRVSRDDFRYMFKNQGFCDNKIEEMISDVQSYVILEALNKKLNVIIDNTNVRLSYINDFIKLVNNIATVEFMVFDISLEEAIERDLKREKTVGSDIIKKMYDNYKVLIDSLDTSIRPVIIKKYINPILDLNKENVILCDIDGTLAHMNGKRGPFSWDKVYVDDVDEIVADRLRKHKLLGEKVIIVTGRDESCKEITENWLRLHDIPYSEILMRPKNDYRKDTIIKKEILHNYILNRYNVLFVYDDRNSVCKMWREEGIKVFQVELGNF